LKRSIQSIEIFGKVPFETDALFEEAKLPHSNWDMLRFNSSFWLFKKL